MTPEERKEMKDLVKEAMREVYRELYGWPYSDGGEDTEEE